MTMAFASPLAHPLPLSLAAPSTDIAVGGSAPRCLQWFFQRQRNMALNNAEVRQGRSRAGLTRELEVPSDTHDAHPSVGGSKGYPLWYRLECLQLVTDHGFEGAAALCIP
jgi:hypothetical protein